MKKNKLILIAIILIVLDNSFMPFLAIKNIYPSLIFIFSICYSIIKGKTEGVFVGVLGGIMQDIFFANCFGLNALINMFICYFAGVIGEGIWKEKRIIPVIIVIASTIIKGFIVFIVLYLMEYRIDLSSTFFVGIYNGVLTIFIYGILYKIYKSNNVDLIWTAVWFYCDVIVDLCTNIIYGNRIWLLMLQINDIRLVLIQRLSAGMTFHTWFRSLFLTLQCHCKCFCDHFLSAEIRSIQNICMGNLSHRNCIL